MVFTRTKRTAQKVADELAERGFAVGAVHGDLGQIAREKALKAFRTGSIDVLVATDVAARGIDVEGVTHVINYQCPDDEKTYVHRIGRTGRAGRTGVAVTLVDWDELARWAMIDKALDLGCPDPAETYSSSPHLYAEMGIPADASGTVGDRRPPQGKRTADGPQSSGPAPRKSNRSRRRTRGGQSVNGHPATTAAGSGEAAAPESDTGEASGDATHSGRRRRRRSRPAAGVAANAN
jgi:superfamily II DNA/RNA helicase